jgi:hypothetical protein
MHVYSIVEQNQAQRVEIILWRGSRDNEEISIINFRL